MLKVTPFQDMADRYANFDGLTEQFYTGYRQARTQDFSLRGVRFYQYDYFAFIFIPIPPDVGFLSFLN